MFVCYTIIGTDVAVESSSDAGRAEQEQDAIV